MSHRIFGVPLEDVMGRLEPGTLPAVLKNIFTYLNAPDHIGTEGLFRVSAGVKELENLKTGLDAGDMPDLKRYDAHLVAGLLKAYFIELPEPLFTFALYDSFIAAADHADNRGQLRSLIQKLPPNNRLLASCLFLFLSRVCSESERNKMNSNNLAIVFGQILLRPKVESLELLRHAPKISNILRIMIDEYYDLFPRTKEDEKLIAKGELSSLEALIGVPSKKKKKKKKPEKDEEDLSPEQLKLRNIKQTVDEAIAGVLDRLEEMAAELNNTASLEETIELAKRIRSAKHILFSNPADESSTSGTSLQ